MLVTPGVRSVVCSVPPSSRPATGRIVAEVPSGLLQTDPHPYLRAFPDRRLSLTATRGCSESTTFLRAGRSARYCLSLPSCRRHVSRPSKSAPGTIRALAVQVRAERPHRIQEKGHYLWASGKFSPRIPRWPPSTRRSCRTVRSSTILATLG